MADITLISGSTLGGAEYVAEHLAEKLEDAGFSTETLHGPLLDSLSATGIWLVISSTHGAGTFPITLFLYMKIFSRKNRICRRFVSARSVLAVANMTHSVVQ